MTRDEAKWVLELIRDRYSSIDVDRYSLTDAETDAINMAIKVLSADIPQWIPCSERLPYSQEDVLCDDDGRVTIGYYTDEEVGWHDMHSYRIYPTAWMPLPNPWKGEEDDKG